MENAKCERIFALTLINEPIEVGNRRAEHRPSRAGENSSRNKDNVVNAPIATANCTSSLIVEIILNLACPREPCGSLLFQTPRARGFTFGIFAETPDSVALWLRCRSASAIANENATLCKESADFLSTPLSRLLSNRIGQQ